VRRFLVTLFVVWLSAGDLCAQPKPFLVTTLNCYLFFGGGSQTNRDFKQPRTAQDYWKKAGNLVSLLPADAPLLVAFEEIGKLREVEHLAQTAAARYRRRFQPVFVQGKDTFTSENVGAMLCLDYGWGLSEKPARDDGLDPHLSKHLVLHLTNAVTSMDVCIVHLLRVISGGVEKQVKQNEALKTWAEEQLAKNPRANVVILGDFNETKNPGDAGQSIECLVRDGRPLVDALTFASGKIKTHADGHAYDRILLSPAVVKGESWLKFQSISSQAHSHGKGNERMWFTDHFPVTVALTLVKPAATR
jgi:endonuclease/exonuclease/phosphatase family metal-dependent hydrolase